MPLSAGCFKGIDYTTEYAALAGLEHLRLWHNPSHNMVSGFELHSLELRLDYIDKVVKDSFQFLDEATAAVTWQLDASTPALYEDLPDMRLPSGETRTKTL